MSLWPPLRVFFSHFSNRRNLSSESTSSVSFEVSNRRKPRTLAFFLLPHVAAFIVSRFFELLFFRDQVVEAAELVDPFFKIKDFIGLTQGYLRSLSLDYAALLKLILISVPRAPRIRTRISKEIPEESPFKIFVILAREVPDQLAISVMDMWLSPTISIIFLVIAYLTSHSIPSNGESPKAFAKSFDVLVIAFLVFFIDQFLQVFPGYFNIRFFGSFSFLLKCVKNNNFIF